MSDTYFLWWCSLVALLLLCQYLHLPVILKDPPQTSISLYNFLTITSFLISNSISHQLVAKRGLPKAISPHIVWKIRSASYHSDSTRYGLLFDLPSTTICKLLTPFLQRRRKAWVNWGINQLWGQLHICWNSRCLILRSCHFWRHLSSMSISLCNFLSNLDE